jgi:hypothetical protein
MDMKYMMFYIHILIYWNIQYIDDNDELCSIYPPLAVPKKIIISTICEYMICNFMPLKPESIHMRQMVAHLLSTLYTYLFVWL